MTQGNPDDLPEHLRPTLRQRVASKLWGFLFTFLEPLAHCFALLDLKWPDYVYEISLAAKPKKLNPDFEADLIRNLSKAKQDSQIEMPLIFVSGEWGAGKTYQLFCYKNKFPEQNIEYFSFWGVHSVQEALLLTIPLFQRFFASASLLLFLVFLYACPPCRDLISKAPGFNWSLLSVIAAIIVVIILIPTKWKVIYAILAYLSHPLGSAQSPRIVILDDLERSGLSEEEQWRVLLSLWKYQVQYIIPIGHGSETQAIAWKNAIAKLHGLTVFLPTPVEAKIELLKYKWPVAPFKDYSGWLEAFTPREILSIYERWFYLTEDKPKFAYLIIFIKIAFDTLLDKLPIPGEKRRFLSLEPIIGGPPYGLHVRISSDVMDLSTARVVSLTIDALLRGIEPKFALKLAEYMRKNPVSQVSIFTDTPEAIANRDYTGWTFE